jgi:hypothetical protein
VGEEVEEAAKREEVERREVEVEQDVTRKGEAAKTVAEQGRKGQSP